MPLLSLYNFIECNVLFSFRLFATILHISDYTASIQCNINSKHTFCKQSLFFLAHQRGEFSSGNHSDPDMFLIL